MMRSQIHAAPKTAANARLIKGPMIAIRNSVTGRSGSSTGPAAGFFAWADGAEVSAVSSRYEAAGDFEAQRAPHRALRELMVRLNKGGLVLDTLSMGMSADLEAAVAEGATIVRVGSAIFGSRG